MCIFNPLCVHLLINSQFHWSEGSPLRHGLMYPPLAFYWSVRISAWRQSVTYVGSRSPLAVFRWLTSSRLRTLAFCHRGCAGLPSMFLLNLKLWLHAFTVFRVARIIDYDSIFSYLTDRSNCPRLVVKPWKSHYRPIYIPLILLNLLDHHQLFNHR